MEENHVIYILLIKMSDGSCLIYLLMKDENGSVSPSLSKKFIYRLSGIVHIDISIMQL